MNSKLEKRLITNNKQIGEKEIRLCEKRIAEVERDIEWNAFQVQTAMLKVKKAKEQKRKLSMKLNGMKRKLERGGKE